MSPEKDLAELARRIQSSSCITALTGAGVSAASGVPTFRGREGLWRNFPPEQLATADAFRRDPGMVWEWYNWRRELISRCQPNAAHLVLAEWSKRFPAFSLITQNVDGLHERAGTQNVIRFHGSIWEVCCWNGCESSPPRWLDESVPFATIPPTCPYCGALVRPGVVWFGESIDPMISSRSIEATWCDIFLTVGTSAIVYPAANLTFNAKEHGAFTVEINPEATPASSAVDLAIQGRAEEVLPKVEALLQGKHRKD